ncbi:MAG: HlyD family efflux transporter periplasmic adaptor subunit [Bacteroidales bacterium]|jgi:HlyD family secretion protein|nr:HlyD family efflux transporter periplasmic adaptor subunit [Bacteroidales bacterium]
MKNRKLAAIIVITFIFLGCNNDKNKFDASGTFETIEILVSSEASGRIMEFNVTEGDILNANQPIGYIDTLQLYLSKLQLEATQETVEGRKTDINVQLASLKTQLLTLQSEKKRFEKLVKSNAGNQKQVDDIDAQILVLEKQIKAQSNNIETSNKSLNNEKKTLAIQIAQIEDKIRKSFIHSPTKGTVLMKYAERGEIVQLGKALFKIADMENMFLKAYLTADQLSQIKLGQEVDVFADSGKNEYNDYKGTIIWISDKSEFTPKTIQTKDERANLVYAVKIAVKNDGYLKIGMYGQIKIQ